MLDVAVIVDPAAAEVALDPVRARLLAELAEPGSATTLAARVGLPRQKVNYHLRTLERHGLIQLVEERKKGNVTERFLRAAAIAFVISPLALAAVQPDPGRSPRDSYATSASSSAAPSKRASAWPPSPSTARSASRQRPIVPPSPRSCRPRCRRCWPSTTTPPP